MARPLAHMVVGLLLALSIGCTAANGSASVVPASGATFQVSLHYDFGNGQIDVQRCAGALISDVWVVTSASCLCAGNLQTCNTDLNRWLIHFGSNVLSTTSVLGVSQIVVNPNWTGNVTDGWDVALFRLNASVNSLRPNMISLALPGSYEWTCQDQNVNVYVWGNQFANQLVVAPAVVVGDWLIYATRQFLNSVADATAQILVLWQCFTNPNCDASAIAVNYLDSNVGLCSADIGAPVVGTAANGQLVLLGVASYRFSGKGIVVDPTRPCIDTYTNGSRVPVIFSQLDQSDAWITSVVGNPTVLTSVCGDGRIGPAEQCDDGNAISGDGCSNVCLLEQDWFCTPASAEWVDRDDSDDDHSASNYILRWLFQVDFCTVSTCHRMAHDDDDDGSSGSIIALIIVLSILGGLLILAIIVFCIVRHRKRKHAVEAPPVVPIEPVVPIVPMAPMITIPASPIVMQAPPSTPAQGVIIDTWSAHALPPVIQQEVATPVQLDIVTPTYGAPFSESLPPIVQREDVIEPPRLEQTAVVGPPTWLKD